MKNTNYLSLFSLKGQIVFVTGGLGLIGREVVCSLAQAGGEVVILDINDDVGEKLKTKLKENGYLVNYEHFDVIDLEKIDGRINELNKKYGKIDIWVNTSYPRTKDWGNKLEDITLKSWRENVEMHMNSYSWISRKVCLVMKQQKRGSVINFGSIHGVVAPDFSVYRGTKMTSPAVYAAIKGGIINFTRYLASYFGKDGIRVNCICPGGIFNNQDEKFVKNYSQKTPLKRMGKPEEIAAATLFLASDAASYVTGVTLMVDGGWSII